MAAFTDADSLFKRMVTPDPVVERQAPEGRCGARPDRDHGQQGGDVLSEKGVDSDFHVISGGIDPSDFTPPRRRPRTI